MINLGLILIMYFVVFGLAEFLYKRGVPGLTTRKIVHIGGGAVSYFLPVFVNIYTAVIIGIFFIALIYFSKKISIFKSLEETNDNHGSVFFPLGLVLCVLIFWRIDLRIFQGAVLVLGLSDGFAGLIGAKWGLKKYKISGEKTYLGSIVFFIITFFVFLLMILLSGGAINGILIMKIFVGSFFVTIVESIFSKGFDNLFVPLASGLVLLLLL